VCGKVKRCLQQEPFLQRHPEAGCFITNLPQTCPRATVPMRKTDTTIYSQSGLFRQRTQTSLGWIRATSDGQYLIYLDWNQTGWIHHDQPNDVSRETITHVTTFFHSGLRCFNLPLQPAGASQSRRHWLDVMAKIPFSPTINYAAFAAVARHRKATHATGTACATNKSG